MRLLNDRLRYSASDVANFLLCRYLTGLDLASQHGLVQRPQVRDLMVEALAKRGEEHEARLVEEFETNGWSVLSLEEEGPDFALRSKKTADALGAGDADVIYQGALLVDDRLGLPDFLIRAELLGEGTGYEVVDAKLARSAKAQAVLQSAYYSELLLETSREPPTRMHLALGNGEWATFRVADYSAYERQIRSFFRSYVVAPPSFPPQDLYPEPVEHCAVCRWRAVCADWRRHDDDLSLVAGMTARQRKALKQSGVSTRRAFAALDEVPDLPRVGRQGISRAHVQAKLQVEGEDSGKNIWRLLDPERTEDGELRPNRGLLGLPEPAEGDLFFDIEGARYYSEDGREFGLQYLFGVVDTADRDTNGDARYRAFWAFNRDQEREAFTGVVDYMHERLSERPDAHVYHYNHYEPTALDHLAELHQAREDVLRQLMGRFASREEELDDLLRRRVFVDLYRIVRQGLQASVESYSIKKLEPFYGFERQVPLSDVNETIIRFDIALDEGVAADDLAGQDLISGYNEDDCRSTLVLRDWLEERRHELASALAEDLPRPVREEIEATAVDPDVASVKEALVLNLPAPEARGPAHHARALLADLLEFFRRDVKPQWWRYFHLRDLSDPELFREPDALSGLTFQGTGSQVKKSTLFQYRFPAQEHGFRPGDAAEDPNTGKPWTVYDIDDAAGTLSILRGPTRLSEPHPTALIEPRPQYQRKTHAASLLELGRQVADIDDAEWPHGAGLDLLLRRRPNVDSEVGTLRQEDEDSITAARRLGLRVDSSYLPIQGPPGTGKTFTAANQILDLVDEGKKVGVTANSHAVICNVLDEVAKLSDERGMSVRIGQKPGEDVRFVNRAAADAQLLFKKNAEARDALQADDVDVVGGSTWVWTHPDLERSVDVLMIDEAGQMSLADALASSRAGNSLILLGDPMQLTQPSQGAHPPGADVSALKHVIGDQETMPEELGLFIELTRRMHPQLRSFTSEVFYEGRLVGIDGLEKQEILGKDEFSGSGLRFREVFHDGNANASPEEAEVVADICRTILTLSWRDRSGLEAPLTPFDVLVVTPFNAQIREIEEAIENAGVPRVAVGTVDKFQGRQAPVVVYSMAASSAEEAPRGMEFLFDLHRLNVATSRAQCLAIVVASPRLLEIYGRTPHQLHLANALCRLKEYAQAE